MKIRKASWNTYAVRGFSYDVANDQASAGGVHLHQIRRVGTVWQSRICQSNGKHRSFGPIETIESIEGEERFTKASQ